MMARARPAWTSALLLFLAACGSGGEPIQIGVAGPLQQSNGRSMRLAAEMAAEEINRDGGVRGRAIELVFKDDQADPEMAIEVAAELRDDSRVVAVIGHITSGTTLAAARVYNTGDGLAAVSPASSSPEVTEAGPWTFRVCPSDLEHSPALAEWTRDVLGRSQVAVMYTNDAYGRGVMRTFAEAFRADGSRLVSWSPYLNEVIDSDSAVDPFIIRAMQRGMRALMIAGQADGAEKIIRAARRLGYTGPVLGADGLTGLKDAGEIAEGVFISSAFLPDGSSQEARRFVAAYQELHGELPDHRGAMTYDALYLLARAIREAGSGRGAIRDYLETVGRSTDPFEGVSGTITFDENGDVVGKEVTIGVVRDGNLVTADRAGA
ncbi:MAG: ABC transporter substrate-binding protein [Longimicrobiaceae bacterium]